MMVMHQRLATGVIMSPASLVAQAASATAWASLIKSTKFVFPQSQLTTASRADFSLPG
jgi:hypothetical protein